MQIAIGLYPRFTALDAIGPYQVLTNLPGAQVVIVAEHKGVLADDNGLLRFDIEHTFEDVPSPDVLLVPGGMITRRIAADKGPIVDWIRQAHETTTWTTSVCTGSLLLGAAGVLEGKLATSHWLSYDHLAGFSVVHGRMDIAANYMLLKENVLDLTHFGFVHAATFGITDWVDPPRGDLDGRDRHLPPDFRRQPAAALVRRGARPAAGHAL